MEAIAISVNICFLDILVAGVSGGGGGGGEESPIYSVHSFIDQ